MKKLKKEVNEYRKALSADMMRLRLELEEEFDEFKAEELDTLTGEYKALLNNPDSYEEV